MTIGFIIEAPISLTLTVSKLINILKYLSRTTSLVGQVLGIRVMPEGISLDFLCAIRVDLLVAYCI